MHVPCPMHFEGFTHSRTCLQVSLCSITDYTKAAARAGKVESEVKRYTHKQINKHLVKLLPLGRLHDEIMAVGGARLKPQQAMVDKLVGEIDEANTVITKATVGIKTNERYGMGIEHHSSHMIIMCYK